MTRGLLAPLSPAEEIALRRVANGSPIIDAQIAANLCRLALIERTPSGLRLTPLGRQRYEAMPKALLLTRRHSLHAVYGYVEGVLEKAQLRARQQQAERRVTDRSVADRAAEPAPSEEIVAEVARPEPEAGHEGPPLLDLVVLKDWRLRAEASIDRVRKSLLLHRAKDTSLCAASRERIEMSRLLLDETRPAVFP